MKKITDLAINKFVIDPSLSHDNELMETIRQFKIDIISHKDNEEILNNLYATLLSYFNDAVVNEVLESCLTDIEIKQLGRDYKLDKLLKK